MTVKKRIGIFLVVGIALAAIAYIGHTNGWWLRMGFGYGYPGDRMFYPGHMMAGGLMHLIFWMILIYAIVSLIAARPSASRSNAETAVDILKKRYAKGDISRQEFTDKLNVINAHRKEEV